MGRQTSLDKAIREQVGLIAMGKLGQKRRRGSRLGPVTERILEVVDLPVPVVSPRQV